MAGDESIVGQEVSADGIIVVDCVVIVVMAVMVVVVTVLSMHLQRADTLHWSISAGIVSKIS
jgi:hypothetical protein